MTRKNRTIQKPTEVEDTPIALKICGAWCFILGAGSGAFCGLEPEHEGDHRVQINVFAEPQARFNIYWQLGGNE